MQQLQQRIHCGIRMRAALHAVYATLLHLRDEMRPAGLASCIWLIRRQSCSDLLVRHWRQQVGRIGGRHIAQQHNRRQRQRGRR